ncbi:hypothetical protein FHT03_001056 [Xanthomonas arboricola]
MDERDKKIDLLEKELEQLRGEFRLTLGRTNGLHLAVLTMARHRGRPTEELIAHLDQAIEAIEATGLHTPLHDMTLEEQLRVAKQVSQVLQASTFEAPPQ